MALLDRMKLAHAIALSTGLSMRDERAFLAADAVLDTLRDEGEHFTAIPTADGGWRMVRKRSSDNPHPEGTIAYAWWELGRKVDDLVLAVKADKYFIRNVLLWGALITVGVVIGKYA